MVAVLALKSCCTWFVRRLGWSKSEPQRYAKTIDRKRATRYTPHQPGPEWRKRNIVFRSR